MKKFSLLLITALFAFGMSAQEVQNVSNGTVYLKDKASDHWFIGLGGGVNTYNMKKFDKFGDRIGWQGQLSVGRWNSPVWGFRGVIDAGEPVINYNTKAKMKWVGGHLDLMYNLTNAAVGYNPDRVYSLVPYLGVGYMYGMDEWFKKPNSSNGALKGQNQSLTYNVGVINNFRLGRSVNLFVEIGYRLLQESFDFSATPTGDYEYDGMLSAVAGLQFGLGGKQEFTPAELMDYNLINDLNSQINRLRAENEELRKRPESCPDCPEVAPAVTESVYVPNVVFFRINSSKIDKGQQVSVYNTAEYLKANPNATVKIVAYADKQTGTPAYNLALSEKRAKAVANALTSEYGIDNSRISIDWKGDTEQPYAENDWNRVAIFFAE
ncbi:MAG: OmpA family protein [Petrimonas sp.]|uniref:OmpA family protein n=1 Tax=Petrimonas sp. TaxID=2023866 RepID=UPI002B38AA5C|nr:OmpA family protein [Petrimonas sp.]MEA5046769.1 OmpA family protein [Petrimonas sp.]MEA5063217.1 OmpA family protein [Petrimonas sp.]